MVTDPKYIYIILSKTGTWLSKVINILTNAEYPHSSISLDDEFKSMYSFGRLNPDNPFSGGFVRESLFDGVYRKFSNCRCVIYRVEVTEEQINCLKEELQRFLSEKKRYRYNFLGLLGVLINKPLERKYHYFCSQFVSELLIKSNILKTDKLPSLIQSRDLLAIENKELYFEGYVNQYHRVGNTYSA